MQTTVGYIEVKEIVAKTDRARRVKLKIDGEPEYWLPETAIRAYDPNTGIMRVESWLLKSKSIKYKLK